MLEYRVFKAMTAKNLIDLAGHLFMWMWKRGVVRFGDFQPIAGVMTWTIIFLVK